MTTDVEKEKARSNAFGLNHILRAEQVQEEQDKKAEQRKQGNSAKDISK